MPHPIKHLLLILGFLLVNCLAYAGRPPGPFRFELMSAESSVYQQGAVMEFRLRIINTDELNTHPVLLPGPKYKGKKFIYLTAHADDNFYPEVAREEAIGVPDTAEDLYTYQLEPEKHLDITLKLYNKPRYAVIPSEPHWFSRPLDPGKYQLQAWYVPYEDLEFTGRAHQGIEDKSQYTGNTDYLAIEIKPASPYTYSKLDNCSDDCGFCRDIEKRNWKKVRNAIEGRLKRLQQANEVPVSETASRGYWLEQHSNVAYISPLPDAILLILPAYWGHNIGFKSGDSLYYYDMTVQLGKLLRGCAKLQTIAYWMFRANLFKTSDVDYIGLKHFRPIPAPNLFPVRQ